MSLLNPVRVRLDSGSEVTVSARYAEAKNLKVLKDVRAADLSGRVIPAVAAPSVAPEDAADLKGKALADALTDAGLPTSGSADEKRARLRDHLANQTTNTPGAPSGDPAITPQGDDQ